MPRARPRIEDAAPTRHRLAERGRQIRRATAGERVVELELLLDLERATDNARERIRETVAGLSVEQALAFEGELTGAARFTRPDWAAAVERAAERARRRYETNWAVRLDEARRCRAAYALVLRLPGAPKTPHEVAGLPNVYRTDRPTGVGGVGEATRAEAREADAARLHNGDDESGVELVVLDEDECRRWHLHARNLLTPEAVFADLPAEFVACLSPLVDVESLKRKQRRDAERVRELLAERIARF